MRRGLRSFTSSPGPLHYTHAVPVESYTFEGGRPRQHRPHVPCRRDLSTPISSKSPTKGHRLTSIRVACISPCGVSAEDKASPCDSWEAVEHVGGGAPNLVKVSVQLAVLHQPLSTETGCQPHGRRHQRVLRPCILASAAETWGHTPSQVKVRVAAQLKISGAFR